MYKEIFMACGAFYLHIYLREKRSIPMKMAALLGGFRHIAEDCFDNSLAIVGYVQVTVIFFSSTLTTTESISARNKTTYTTNIFTCSSFNKNLQRVQFSNWKNFPFRKREFVPCMNLNSPLQRQIQPLTISIYAWRTWTGKLVIQEKTAIFYFLLFCLCCFRKQISFPQINTNLSFLKLHQLLSFGSRCIEYPLRKLPPEPAFTSQKHTVYHINRFNLQKKLP